MKRARPVCTAVLHLGYLCCLLVVLLGAASAQICVPPTAGLIGWWPGDGNADDIQGGHNGTLQGGVTFTPGEVDQAFNFDGSTGFVRVPQNSLWEFGSNDFTVDFWINFRTPNTSETLDSPDVFDIIGVDEGGGPANKWVVRFGGGVLTLLIHGTDQGPAFLAQAPFSPNLHQWYFIAVTRSGNTFTTYINGEAAATETMTITIPSINAPLTWGLVEEERHLDGLMDEVEIYNRGLSATEIQAIFDAGSVGKCKEGIGGVGGTVTGLRPALIVCENLSTQQTVVIGEQAPSWNCETAGLEVTPDDIIRITLVGGAQ